MPPIVAATSPPHGLAGRAGLRPRVPRSTLHRLAAIAVISALSVAGACSGDGGDRTEAPSTPTTASHSGAVYQVPAMHPSDWGAPAMELPDAPRPYGPSPEATADPAFYDVGALDADDAAAALEQFGPDVVPVAPDRFAGLLRGAAAAGYTGSPDAVAPARPAPGACRADAANIAWDTVPVIAAFLANAMLAGDLAANTTAVGDAVTVDETLLAEAVRSTFQALAPLAFSAAVAAGAEFDAAVTGLELASGAGATPTATGTLTFTATFDPGDGSRTARATVPITCTPRTAP